MVRAVVTLAGGTAAAQAITVCAMPIVTRLYAPAQMGVLSLFLSYFSFWVATLSLRYEYAVLIAEDDNESRTVKRLAMIVVIAMSILGAPSLWALTRTGVLGFGSLPLWVSVVVIPTLLGYGFYMVYRSWALRAGLVRTIAGATIARSATNSGLQVVLGALALGVPGLFIAQVMGSWAAIFRLFRSVRTHYLSTSSISITGRGMLTVARKYWKFPVFEAPSTWVDQLALTLPVPLIAALHGAAAAGWFGLARMMVAVPNSQVGSAVADVFQAEMARAVILGDTVRARTLFYKLLGKLALFGLLPFVGIAILGPILVPFIFGDRWYEAGIAAAGIVPWLYAAFVVSPLSRALSVLQMQQYKLIYDVSGVLLLAGAFWISKVRGYSFFDSVLAMSGAGTASYVVYAIVLVAVIETHHRRTLA